MQVRGEQNWARNIASFLIDFMRFLEGPSKKCAHSS
jgi:hypothetical protein